MAPKKAATKTATHASYRDMIKDAIINVSPSSSRHGRLFSRPLVTPSLPSGHPPPPPTWELISTTQFCRVAFYLVPFANSAPPTAQGTQRKQALKKYVQANNRINITSQSAFDAQFNRAVKTGVEKGDFTQPKGPSGPLKLAKKEPAKPAAKKAAKPAAAKKEKAPAKKATAKATTTTKKAAAPKKTAAAAKPKANVAKPRKAPAAPAVVDTPKVTKTTKSGRVTKTTAKPTPKKKTTGPKKTTTKKATPKKAAA
ncbi:histone H1/5 [Blastomyces parvus]|uniref:Histone H1 n=1 Tax=Blastomyces parvus TaxID=2060905 RepID=A0A2B7XDJ2_9EURO|nr:histone H1/5 [Blastomyces parvus]